MAAEIHFTVDQQESLEQLRDAISIYQGKFALIFAHCSYSFLRDRLIAALLETPDLRLEVIDLLPETESLLDRLDRYFQARPQSDFPDGVLIRGFELVEKLPQLLTAINQVRESLKRNCPMPIVFWLKPKSMEEIMRSAPDMESWSVGVEFKVDVQDLIQYIESIHQDFLVELKAGNFVTSTFFPVEIQALEVELDTALQGYAGAFGLEQQAKLQTILGTIYLLETTYNKIYRSQLAIDTYQRALAIYQELKDLEAQSIIYNQLVNAHYYLGFSEHQYIAYISPEVFERLIEEQRQPDSAWRQGYGYIRQTLEIWRTCQSEENIAWGLPFWHSTLRYLECWSELEGYSRQALSFLERESRQYFRVMYYLAEALEAQGKTAEAQEHLEQLTAEVEAEHYIYPLSRQILARIYRQEGKLEKAFQLLTEAKQGYDLRSLSRSHITILEEQREILFELGRYLEAYQVKQEKQLAEYEYGFKAFIGATRIEQRRDEVGMSAAIRASGRGKDVEKLVKRITERIDGQYRSVTVIYGYSGVGKSSLVNAGLIPELMKSQQSNPNGYVQIVLRSYGDWQETLLSELEETVPFDKGDLGGSNQQNSQHTTSGSIQPTEDPPQPPFGRGENLEKQIFGLLKDCDRKSQLVVLIFDQFEEFFFTCEQETERQALFSLLGQVINETSYVNIVFSLRRDYTHFLLGWDQLKRGNQVIDLLSRENGYELQNFSRDEAIQVFQGLTAQTSFQPEEKLIKAVVTDLIEPVSGLVRPIELQIVGRQLETLSGGITQWSEYERLAMQNEFGERISPKTELVKCYLEDVIEGCGTTENQRLAWQLLYLLTDKKGRRPLKTFDDLTEGLIPEQKIELTTVDLVLQILVISDLVSEVQDRGAETAKYQLVHDYLVGYVREIEEQNYQQQLEDAKKKAEQEKERADQEAQQRQTAQASLKAIEAEVLTLQERRLEEEAKSQELQTSLQAIQTDVVEAKAAKQDLERKNKRSAIILGFTSVAAVVSVVVAGIAGTQIDAAKRRSQEAETRASEATDAANQAESKRKEAVAQSELAQEQADSATRVAGDAETKSAEAAEKEKAANQRASQAEGRIAAAEKRLGVADQKVAEAAQTLADAEKKFINATDRTELAQTELKDAEKKLEEARQEQTFARKITDWERRGNNLIQNFQKSPAEQIFILLESIKLAQEMQSDKNSTDFAEYPTSMPYFALQQSLNQIKFKNVLSEHSDQVSSIDFNSSGTKIVSSAGDKSIVLWTTKGELLKVINKGHDDEIEKVTFAPHGDFFASKSADNVVKLWNSEGQELITRGDASSLIFSPDKKTLAISFLSGEIELWKYIETPPIKVKTITNNVSSDFRSGNQYRPSIAFSKDGEKMAFITNDNDDGMKGISIWKINGKNSHEIVTNERLGYLSEIRFDRNNKILTYFSDPRGRELPRVQVWNLDKNMQLQEKTIVEDRDAGMRIEATFQNEYSAVAFGDSSTGNFTREIDKSLRLFFLSSFNMTYEPVAEYAEYITINHGSFINDFQFSPDGRSIATISNEKLTVFDLLGFKIFESVGGSQLTFSPDGKSIATIQNNEIHLISTLDDQLKLFENHADDVAYPAVQGLRSGVLGVTFSLDGKTIMSVSSSNLRLWNTNGQELVDIYDIGSWLTGRETLTEITSRNDQSSIILDSNLFDFNGVNYNDEFYIQLSDISSHISKIFSFPTKAFFFRSDVASNIEHGKYVGHLHSTRSPGQYGDYDYSKVHLWDLDENYNPINIKELLTTKDGIHHPSYHIAATINSDLIVVADKEKIYTFDLTGNRLTEFRTQHVNKINDVAISSDSQLIASASDDGTIQLWTTSGRQLGIFVGHRTHQIYRRDSLGGVTSVSFSPNGQFLVSGSSDNTVRVWRIESLDEMIARGCRYLQDYLLHSRDAEDKEEYRQMCQEYFL